MEKVSSITLMNIAVCFLYLMCTVAVCAGRCVCRSFSWTSCLWRSCTCGIIQSCSGGCSHCWTPGVTPASASSICSGELSAQGSAYWTLVKGWKMSLPYCALCLNTELGIYEENVLNCHVNKCHKTKKSLIRLYAEKYFGAIYNLDISSWHSPEISTLEHLWY